MSIPDNPQQFTHLDEWLAWLEQAHSIHNIELGLERAQKVARRLDLIHLDAQVITVAGTNGKGSTVAAIEALAVSHKVSVGCYTSPHLIHFNERMKLNGESASDELIIEGFRAVYEAKGDTRLTYFEFTTLVALWLFKQQQLDLIVLEVGLGGRLDAVNIIDSDISVVTSIGLDHVDWLGSDLKQIAGEKAGVARRDRPLIIADKETESLLLPHCETVGCIPWVAQRDFCIQLDRKYWSYQCNNLSLDFHELPLNELFLQNLAAGLTAFSYCYQSLSAKNVSYAATYKAFESLSVLGRFQVLSESPTIIVDVAHNPDSAKLLNQKLAEFKDKGSQRVVALCGMLKDKDCQSSLAEMKQVDEWHLLDLPEPRGKKSAELLQNLPEVSQNTAKCYGSLSEFSESCIGRSCLGTDDVLVVFGSFITVGLFVEHWNKEGFAWI
ncbi:bifunctional tetrahydrofolate synthase/dihydrofolate synthase [Kangiella geojedonensis]|uniref:Dihydrofolate synthase/folylpolyglutamate synthase n=1 Tax=Kangiella geojedonensis TaxID=914150 RepID=A0A0F6RCD1_9GAMM|nr:bifunctional tetrahydrofolate synthase/dihydrofolate synthase [Kangiella geojedonensis]AKE51931.1 FolC bifunctional protein [Kangiella geojedonensis]